jgi:hypothetical protein
MNHFSVKIGLLKDRNDNNRSQWKSRSWLRTHKQLFYNKFKSPPDIFFNFAVDITDQAIISF